MPLAGYAVLVAAAVSNLSPGFAPQDPDPKARPQGEQPPYEVAAPPPQSLSNVSIGLVTDSRAVFKDRAREDETTELREAEFSFAAAVDPFLTAEAFIAVANEEGETVTEIEEAFGTYSRLGNGLSGTFGKFKAAVGRVNRLHTHALPSMDLPFVIQDTFGEEGLSGVGGELSYLLPTERFVDITVQAIGAEDGPLFSGTRASNPIGLAHVRTFFDFSEDLSGQLGFTAANGPTSLNRGNVLGLDYTMKYQPGTSDRFWQFETEAYWSDRASEGADRTMGWFAAFTAQISPKLFATARLDYSEAPNSGEVRRGTMLNFTLKPTEFHHWRLEFQHFDNKLERDFDRLSLQFVWLIGAHPVHKY